MWVGRENALKARNLGSDVGETGELPLIQRVLCPSGRGRVWEHVRISPKLGAVIANGFDGTAFLCLFALGFFLRG